MDLPLFLYTDRPHTSFDIEQVAEYLKCLGFSTDVRGDFFEHFNIPFEDVTTKFAKCRIRNLRRNNSLNTQPTSTEIKYERDVLESHDSINLNSDLSNIYDAFELGQIMKSFLKKGLHILFTSRMFATFEGTRYHGRVITMDFPIALISTTGVVEAPAKPKEFYIKLAAYNRAKSAGLRVPEEKVFMAELKEEIRGHFIDYDYPLLTDVMKGYTLQAAFYMLRGEVFCENPECRLYNAHIQEDMLYAQIESGMLCKNHLARISNLNGGR